MSKTALLKSIIMDKLQCGSSDMLVGSYRSAKHTQKSRRGHLELSVNLIYNEISVHLNITHYSSKVWVRYKCMFLKEVFRAVPTECVFSIPMRYFYSKYI